MSKFNYSTALEKARSLCPDFDSLLSFQELPLSEDGSTMTSLKEFQDHVFEFSRSDIPFNSAIANFAMGLSGESGEVTDLLKKYLFHDKPIDREKLVSEMGDVLWYWVALCNQLGLSPSDVMASNIEKLQKRHEGQSFNAEVANRNKEEET